RSLKKATPPNEETPRSAETAGKKEEQIARAEASKAQKIRETQHLIDKEILQCFSCRFQHQKKNTLFVLSVGIQSFWTAEGYSQN
ncbi:MAG: hypothetical protein ACQXXJ_03990, partial [Candidatus Bathyarchaeia archaeon]